MDGTDSERSGIAYGSIACPPLNELPRLGVAVGFESANSEFTEVGVGSASKACARVSIALRTGSSKDGRDSQKSGDQELGAEEHRDSERRRS